MPPLWFCIFCRENIKNKSKAFSWGLTLFMWNLYTYQAFKAFSCHHLNLHFVRWNIGKRNKKHLLLTKCVSILLHWTLKQKKQYWESKPQGEHPGCLQADIRTSSPGYCGTSWIQVWFPTSAHLRDHATVSTLPGMAYTFQEGRHSES